MDQKDFSGLEIAIVGYSGRFDGCENMDDLWQQLAEGRSSIHDFTNAELDALGFSPETYNSTGYVRSNGILEQKDCFDAEFWGYTPTEAAVMDPQMRIFHELVWEALEMAGYAPDATEGKVGIFGSGSSNAQWQTLVSLQDSGGLDPLTVNYFSNVELLCSRVSYRLNLKGPALFVATACSSSLMAVHQASRALLTGECNMALAGGVCASILKLGGYQYTDGFIFSDDGKCRPFDHKASGTVSGEGGGVVALKRYSQALKDGDTIYGIIRGSASNNDGDDKIAYTAPSVKGQVDVIKKALSVARVKENTISFVESHGTATKLGDAIELKALQRCFGTEKVHVGAIKSNIGHLDGASGIAGFLKVLLMFKHKKIPATAHFESMNSEMKEVEKNLLVNNELLDWQRNGTPRRAGVSSFGIGGTNVHVIVQEPETSVSHEKEADKPLLYTLSAKTPQKLEQVKARLLSHLQENDSFNACNTAFTLLNRTPFTYRTALVASNQDALISQLSGKLDATHGLSQKGEEPTVFVFGGQGTQYHHMLEDLYHTVPAYKELVDKCFTICENKFNINLKSILFSDEDENLHETLYTQLALFTVQYAYAQLLINNGIKPYAMIGHSIGEYVAAALAGVYSVEDAISIVHKRGLLMQENCKGGGMCAIFTSREELADLLPQDLELGAENGPDFQVVSGPAEKVKEWASLMNEKGYTSKILAVKYAFHSKAMEPILAEFETFVNNIPTAPAGIPIVSNLTGEFTEKMDASYWSAHMRNPVLFAKGIDTLLKSGYNTFVDFGFGKQLSSTLMSLGTEIQNPKVLEAIRHRKKATPDYEVFLSLLGGLWTQGYPLDHQLLFGDSKPKRTALPTYPFERTPFPAPFNLKKLLKGKLDFMIDEEVSQTEWVYEPKWVKSTTHTEEVHQPNQLVIICDDEATLPSEMGSLSESAKEVVWLLPGDKYERQQKGRFTFRLNSQESDLDMIMAQLAEEGFMPDSIIHSLAMQEATPITTPVDNQLQRGYLNLVFLMRAVHNHLDVPQLNLTVLGTALFAISEGDAVNPIKTSIAGALKVMSVEYGYLHCKIIDLENSAMDNVLTTWEELDHRKKFSLVAIRGNQRFIPEIRPTEAPEYTKQAKIAQDDCIVVVGGTGGMGLWIGADIAENDGAEVVLVHRSPFPARRDWKKALQDEGLDEVMKLKLRRLLQLQRSGARVHLYQADVTKPDQLEQVLDDIQAEVGDISGLIWAAGVIDEAGVVQKRSAESFTESIESKVHSLLHLEKVLNFNKLGFLMLFSSMGNIRYENKGGQIGYNVANEFLEAFAGYAQTNYSCKTTTINWMDWADVGMTVRALKSNFNDLSQDEINDKIEDALTPKEGVSIFRYCLTHLAPVFYLSKSTLGSAQTREKTLPVAFARPEISTPFSKPEGKIEQQIATILTTTFGIDRVGRHDDFFELGGDSLKAIQITNHLRKSFDKRVSLEQFYEQATIAKLAILLTEDEEGPDDHEIQTNTAQLTDFPALAPQRLVHIATELFPEATNYNQPFFYEVPNLDLRRLKEVLQALAKRHQALRISFYTQEEGVFLSLAEQVEIPVETYAFESEKELTKVMAEFVRPFNLKESPLLRVAVATSKNGSAYLLVDIHHIISDGISNLVFQNELLSLYKGETLPPLEKDLLDYVSLMQRDEEKKDQEALKHYWLQRFSEVPEKMNLFGVQGMDKTLEGETIEFELDAQLHQDIKTICRQEGTTSFVFYLTAFNTLLYKLSGQKDIVVGTTLTGRDEAGFEHTMGMFVQTLALRNQIEPTKLFSEVLEETKEQTIRDFDHRSYPYEDLLRELNITRDGQSSSLFDIVFAGENLMSDETTPSESTAATQLKNKGYKEVVFDLLFAFFESESKTIFSLEYKKSRTDAGFIRRLFQCYETLLNQVIDSGKLKPIKVSDVQLQRATALNAILKAAHGKTSKYPADQTIGRAFSKVAQVYSEDTALLADGQEISYAELETKSNAFARFLQENHGLKAGDTVGIMLERSAAFLTAVLGIVKAGGVFVPIAPEYPWARKEYVLTDSNAKVLVTDSGHMFNMGGNYEGSIIAMDIQEYEFEAFNSDVVEADISSTDLAYMIYTSGSTGKPKGVMVQHNSLINYITWASKTYIGDRKTAMPLHTNISFDLTLTSLFLPLLSGNKLVLYPGESHDLLLRQILGEGDCNLIKLTPSHLRALRAQGLENLPKKEEIKLIVGGEELDRELALSIHEHYQGNIEIYNEYGPTEATIGCMVHLFAPDEKYLAVPIGKAMDNGAIYLLNEQLEPVVPGMTGEIFIGGECLARGYMNKPEMTNERFIEVSQIPGGKVYRTGDLAYMLPNGNLMYQGRKDEQVKIRGYRVELAEVSGALASHPNIQEAVVIQRGNKGDTALAAYYVASKEIGVSELRDHLTARLPEYMLPSYFKKIDHIPLTPNGKLDEKALPAHTTTTEKLVKPEGKLEIQLQKIWASALDQAPENISVTAKFFHIGGDSLRALAIIRQIETQIGARVSIRDFFDNASVRMNAQLLSDIKKSDSQTLTLSPVKLEKRESYQASSSQERMLFERLMDEDSLKYNMTMGYQLDDELDAERIRSVFQKLIERHEILRTRIFIDDDEIKQQIVDDAPVDLEILDSTRFSSLTEAYSYFVRPFDLHKVPILRCGLLESPVHGRCLLIDTHHAVADGISLNILMHEFMKLTKNEPLPAVNLRYVDYAQWQKSNEEMLTKQEEFWKKQLAGNLPSIHLPIKAERKSRTLEGQKLSFKTSLEEVNKVVSELEISTYLLLLTLYSVTMQKFSGDRDIIIGTDGDGRTHAGFSHTIGTFINVLPLRLEVDPEMTLRDLLIHVRATTLSALDNQDYPFDKMQNLANLPHGTSLVDVYFSYTNFFDEDTEYLSAGFTPLQLDEKAVHVRYDLELNVAEMNDQLHFEFMYDQSLFDPASIEQFKAHYTQLLTGVSEKFDLKISDLSRRTVIEPSQQIH